MCSHLLWSQTVSTLCWFESSLRHSCCLAGMMVCWGCAGPSPAPPPALLSCPSSRASPRGDVSAPSPAGTPSAGWNSQRAPLRTRWATCCRPSPQPSTAGSAGTPGGPTAGSWLPEPPREHLLVFQPQLPVPLPGPWRLFSGSPALLSAAGYAPAKPPWAELSASSRRRCGGGAAPRALGGAPDKIEHLGVHRFEKLGLLPSHLLLLQSPAPCPRGWGGWVQRGVECDSAEGRQSAEDCRSSSRGATGSSRGAPARLQLGRPRLIVHAAALLHVASKQLNSHTHTHRNIM